MLYALSRLNDSKLNGERIILEEAVSLERGGEKGTISGTSINNITYANISYDTFLRVDAAPNHQEDAHAHARCLDHHLLDVVLEAVVLVAVARAVAQAEAEAPATIVAIGLAHLLLDALTPVLGLDLSLAPGLALALLSPVVLLPVLVALMADLVLRMILIEADLLNQWKKKKGPTR